MPHKVTNRATGSTFEADAGETVLAAARRSGLNLPYSCRNGGCASCKAQLVSGDIEYPLRPPDALTVAEREQGLALLCQAVARSDLTIVVREVEALKDIRPRKLITRVKALDFPGPDVARLHLGLRQHERLNFLAGQYLEIILSDDHRRAFSIAGAPAMSNLLELHIRRIEGGGFTDHVFNQMQVGELIRIEAPLGTFFLRDRSARPLICVAGGTGFAPIKAIVEQSILNNDKRPLRLYWGARREAELYSRGLVEQWSAQADNITFVPVLSEPDAGWSGRTGLVHAAVLQDFADLSIFDLYMSGPPALVDVGRQEFVNHGLPEAHLFYDSLEFVADIRAQTNDQQPIGEVL